MECVYSSEEQVTEMLPLSKEQRKNPEEFGVVDNFRYMYMWVRLCVVMCGDVALGTWSHAGCLYCLVVFRVYDSGCIEGSEGTSIGRRRVLLLLFDFLWMFFPYLCRQR